MEKIDPKPLTLFQGMTLNLYINQGYREAEVLSVVDEQALVEYYMPNGTTSLRIMPVHFVDEIFVHSAGRKCSYKNVPMKFLHDMVNLGVDWYGRPQQNRGKYAPSPEETLIMRQKSE